MTVILKPDHARHSIHPGIDMKDEVSTSGVYWIRPDIFIKSGDDKLYLRYQEKHYVLKTPGDRIADILLFLDLFDGRRGLASILAEFPEARHSVLQRMLGFLVDKGAAFAVAPSSSVNGLSAVADTLAYLAEYSGSPVDRYRRFAAQRLVLAGGGYSLISAIKTLARIGSRRLFVLHGPALGRHRFADADLMLAFDSARAWPDAEMVLVEPSSLRQQAFDWLLECSESTASEVSGIALERAAPAGRLLGSISAGSLVIADAPMPWSQPSPMAAGQAQPGPVHLQTAGACFALAAFDAITAVRPWLAGHYGHYPLDGIQPLRFAPRVQLRSWPELDRSLPAVAESKRVVELLDAWHECAPGPLFPIERPEEITAESSYVKVYRLAYSVWRDGRARRQTVLAAGYDRPGCLREALAVMASVGGLWLEGSDVSERMQMARTAIVFQRVRRLVADLSPSLQRAVRLGELAAPALSAREEYIQFCIGSRFSTAVIIVDMATGDAEMPRCRAALAGSIAVHMPYCGDVLPADGERLLFRLYAELCRAALGDDACLASPVLVATALVEHEKASASTAAADAAPAVAARVPAEMPA